MVSRYFTYNNPQLCFQPGEGPDSPDYAEVTDDGRSLRHMKNGTSGDNTAQLLVPALEAAMRYVRQGNWVEIAFDANGKRYVVDADVPAASYGEVW